MTESLQGRGKRGLNYAALDTSRRYLIRCTRIGHIVDLTPVYRSLVTRRPAQYYCATNAASKATTVGLAWTPIRKHKRTTTMGARERLEDQCWGSEAAISMRREAVPPIYAGSGRADKQCE